MKQFLIKTFFFLILCLILKPEIVNAQITIRRNIPEADFLEERLDVPIKLIPNYRDILRDIITDLSIYAKGRNPDFNVISKEGLYLLFKGEWEEHLAELERAQEQGLIYEDEKFLVKMFEQEQYEQSHYPIGTPIRRYIHNLDGVIIEGRFCENNSPDEKTLQIINDAGLFIFGIENCSNKNDTINALKTSASLKIPLHINNNKYNKIPNNAPALENQNNIYSLKDIRNMLLITNPDKNYGSRAEFLLALSETNYDLLIIDPFYNGNEAFTKNEINSLKFKKLGSKRKVFAKVNLTEAEDYRYYWKKSWRLGNPSWLRLISKKNPYAIIAEYWKPEWKEIIGKYVKGIIDLGFDGIIFDGLDNHLNFENLTPID